MIFILENSCEILCWLISNLSLSSFQKCLEIKKECRSTAGSFETTFKIKIPSFRNTNTKHVFRHLMLGWKKAEKGLMEDEGTGNRKLAVLRRRNSNRVDPILPVLGSILCLICRSRTWSGGRPSYDSDFFVAHLATDVSHRQEANWQHKYEV